ncbi:MAG: M3 family metallopeptidase [Opitutales bacterium]|nr:M3 family metallopeptidase [Opitutales bacterium]
MNHHPFLQTKSAPNWDELTPDCIRTDLTIALESAENQLEKIRKLSPEETTFDNTIKAVERSTLELNQAWGLVVHLDSVCNSPELREAHNDMLPAISAFLAKITLDPELWQAIKSFNQKTECKNLEPVDRRLLDEIVKDFEESGANLPEDKRNRLEEISSELAKVTQTFSEHVLDATNAWSITATEESELQGLPENAKVAARQTAIEQLGEEKGANCWVFTLHAPSMLPVLQYADNEELRKEVWSASDRLCAEEPYQNEPLIREILKLRQEKAEILGKSDFADVALARRMAKTGANANAFVDEILSKALPSSREENKELETFKAKKTASPTDLIEPWEVGYWCEKLKKESYDFDEEDLRPFFPIQSVLSGMFELASQIFGLQIIERSTHCHDQVNQIKGDRKEPVSVWHPDVRYYDLFDQDENKLLGSFYADWHPRSSKRGGAWMNFLRTAEKEDETHLGLICGNLTAPTPDTPALLTHYEVQTVFHEFGHLLHHLCGKVKHPSLNGVNVAWDFVELPSQIMENWCWQRESLDLFARHHETGDIIPDKLFDKMIRARNFFEGNATIRQMAFSKLDLFLHREWSKSLKGGLEEVLQKELGEFLPKRKSSPRTIALRFSHLFSSPIGYAAAYYSYKWAEVLDADAFTRFQSKGVMNPDTGRDFRDQILSKGNAQSPDQLYRNFMGREPKVDALLQRSGLA